MVACEGKADEDINNFTKAITKWDGSLGKPFETFAFQFRSFASRHGAFYVMQKETYSTDADAKAKEEKHSDYLMWVGLNSTVEDTLPHETFKKYMAPLLPGETDAATTGVPRIYSAWKDILNDNLPEDTSKVTMSDIECLLNEWNSFSITVKDDVAKLGPIGSGARYRVLITLG
jgi:hypothetical protein